MLFWLDFVGLLGVDGSPLCSLDTLRFYRTPHPSHLSLSHVPLSGESLCVAHPEAQREAL